MTRKTLLTTLSVLLAALTLFASAGCSSGTPTSSAAGSSTASAQPATPPTIKVTTPVDGAEVPAGEVKVAVETTGLKFVMPNNKPVPGEGHVHFTLDDEPFKMSTEPGYTFKDVAAGKHRLKAELVQNDTKSFDPPVEQEVAFTVK